MPKYSARFWETYLADRDASKLVDCIRKEVVGRSTEVKRNVNAIKAVVKLARQQGPEAYFTLQDVAREGKIKTIGPTGGLYPWLKEYGGEDGYDGEDGADILEKHPNRKAYRIRKEFYNAMLDLFAEPAPKSTSGGILRLQGLGKEVWVGIDAQAYVNRERSAWAG
jgi:hypothetical protein